MDNLFELPSPLEIWIPVNITHFHFTLKESVKLPELHLFLLSAISDSNLNIDDIVDATLLSKSLIEQELSEMYHHKLLEVDDDGKYQLSQLSIRLLQYNTLVSMMNDLNPEFVYDYVSGCISPYVDIKLEDEASGPVANRLFSSFEIECIEPKEIKDTLLTTFPLLCETEMDVIDAFLDSIVIETDRKKCNKWKKKYITKLPTSPSGAESQAYKVRCYMNQRRYQVYDEFFESNSDMISMLNEIRTFDASLLHKKALDLLERWEKYRDLKQSTVDFYINPITNIIADGTFNENDNKKSIVFDIQQFQFSKIDECVIEQKISNCCIEGFSLRLIQDSIVPYISQLPFDCIVDELF